MTSSISQNIQIKSNDQCNITDSLGIILQLIMVLIIIIIIVIKRYLERPRRTWKIWFLNIIKIYLPISIIHIMNIMISIYISNKYMDSCYFMFINNFMDCTLGVIYSYIIIRMTNYTFKILQLNVYIKLI